MKKLLSVAAALAILLCACGGEGPEPYTTADADALLTQEGLFNGDLAQIDASITALLYGIDQAAIVDCASYQATNTSVSADELTVLVMDNEAAAQVAETACQLRVETQLQACRDYCPAAIPRLEGAVIRRIGASVLLAVGDPDLLPAAVDALRG